MHEVKLLDHSFAPSVSPFYQPRSMRWKRVRGQADFDESDTVVFTNNQLQRAKEHRAGRKVAWLLESRGVAWPTYEYVEDHLDEFDLVLTYDESLIAIDPDRCEFAPRGGTYLSPEEVALYPKSKLVSFISSNKRFDQWTAVGHGFRQDLWRVLRQLGGSLGRQLTRAGVKERVDSFGRITGTALERKIDSLRDYRFQIAVENRIHDSYFTEKLIDCFATGTIPIFRGTKEVCRFFDPRGIVFVDTLEEMVDVLIRLCEEDYEDRLDAVRENYERCQAFLAPEDWMVRHTSLVDGR